MPAPPRPHHVVLGLLLAASTALGIDAARAEKTDPDDDLAGVHPVTAAAAVRLTEASGVRLVLGRTSSWEGRFQVRPLDPALADRAVRLTRRLLERYPRALLDGVIDEIRFVGDAATTEGTWGGIARCDERRLVVKLAPDALDVGVLRAMHHEVGHLLHCRLDLDEDAWTSLDDRPYAATVAAWRRRIAPDSARHLSDPGFATAYAMASFEEDVAETFALAVTRPDALAHLPEARPALARKVALLERAVRELEPTFSFATPATVTARR